MPAKHAAGDPAQLAALEAWLRSYRPEELFDAAGRPVPEVLAVVPAGERCMGANRHANGGRLRRPLVLPDPTNVAVRVSRPGAETASALEAAGGWLA